MCFPLCKCVTISGTYNIFHDFCLWGEFPITYVDIPEENGSSDYLQEILGSFHSIEGNKCWSKEGLDDSGTNDDEYQIFGEDSDFDDYLDD